MNAGKALIASALAAFSLAAIPNLAAADGACPPGLHKKGWCDKFPHNGSSHQTRRHDADGDRSFEREDKLDDAYEEGYRDGRTDALRVGARLNRDRYRILDRDLYYDRYGRPLNDSYYYAEADGRQLLIESATGVILDILSR